MATRRLRLVSDLAAKNVRAFGSAYLGSGIAGLSRFGGAEDEDV